MNLPSAPLELTPRQQLLQFAHVLQSSLFPRLEEELGPLGKSAKLLVETLALVPLTRFLPRHRQGRPAKSRSALAAAFLAKSIYGFTDTRQLIEQLKVMRKCAAAVAGGIPGKCRMSPPSRAPSPPSRVPNSPSSYTPRSLKKRQASA